MLHKLWLSCTKTCYAPQSRFVCHSVFRPLTVLHSAVRPLTVQVTYTEFVFVCVCLSLWLSNVNLETRHCCGLRKVKAGEGVFYLKSSYRVALSKSKPRNPGNLAHQKVQRALSEKMVREKGMPSSHPKKTETTPFFFIFLFANLGYDSGK